MGAWSSGARNGLRTDPDRLGRVYSVRDGTEGGGASMGILGGLEITTEVENDKTVLTLRGKVTIGQGDVEFKNAIRSLLDQGVKEFVIDLKNVTKIDSSGLGELVAAHLAASNRGGNLELRHLPSKFQDILGISNFPNFPNFPGGFAF
jgi:anti-sigma B factor antagonist